MKTDVFLAWFGLFLAFVVAPAIFCLSCFGIICMQHMTGLVILFLTTGLFFVAGANLLQITGNNL